VVAVESPVTRVHELIEPLLAPSGVELVDVELKAGVLQISIDRPGGIDLDAVSQAATIISAALDDADPIEGRYTLEVSSPGLERPLRTPEHFRRFVGTTITVKTKPTVEGDRRTTGRLDDADDEGFTLAGRRLRYDEVERARTVFEWGPAPKPGGGSQRTKKQSSKKPSMKNQSKNKAPSR
jgi:ribosome maturation factor RimP